MSEWSDTGISLPPGHPAAPIFIGTARQCSECQGIWFPGPYDCPYCAEEDTEEDPA